MNRFDLPLSVVLDGAGAGTVTASVPWGQDWTVTAIATSTDQEADVIPYPVCRVYRGGASPGNLVAATYSGQLDTARGNERFLPGEQITVQWTGGVPGVRATVHIIGESRAR